MVRARSVFAGIALTAAAGLAAVALSSPASAAPARDGASRTSAVQTVGDRAGVTHVVPMKAGGARTERVALASGPSYHGCPYGAVCVYPAGKGWNGDRPKYFFYSYAGHNIYNEFGTHRIADNQYGSHSAAVCAGYNGTGGLANVYGIRAEGGPYYYPVYWDVDLTPVNSLDLRPYSEYESLCFR